MNKLLLSLAFLALVILSFGSGFDHNSNLFWLSSASTSFQIARFVLCIVLFLMLFTSPPRNVWFRLVAGAIALGFGAWTVGSTATYHMELLDTLAFTSSAVIILATALEPQTKTIDFEASNANGGFLA